MALKAAILLFDGFEEIEAVTTIDLLRRANIIVHLISLDNKKLIRGSHYIEIATDLQFTQFEQEISSYDGLILPGGPGISSQLLNNDNLKLIEIFKRFNQAGKLIAAICAAPQFLGKAGLLNSGIQVTHYPGCNQYMFGSIELLDQTLVYDNSKNILTASCAGASIQFALKIIEILKNIDTSNLINSQVNPQQINKNI